MGYLNEVNQLALAIHLNDEITLSNFCWGENNLLRQEVKKSLTGKGERFFTIWGVPGSGKSHLLQGWCQAFASRTSIYFPLRMLQEYGPASIENLAKYELIAIDDVEIVAGILRWEEALFHLYNQVHANNETILIISSGKPINNIKFCLADLQSRLHWGLMLQLYELNDDAKIQVLHQYALIKGFELPKSVGKFLINRCTRNMHNLLALINQLDKASLIAQRKITIPFVKQTLFIQNNYNE